MIWGCGRQRKGKKKSREKVEKQKVHSVVLVAKAVRGDTYGKRNLSK